MKATFALACLLFVMPVQAREGDESAESFFMAEDFCGAGKSLRQLKVADSFSHVTDVDLLKAEAKFLEGRFGGCKGTEKHKDGYLLHYGLADMLLELSYGEKGDIRVASLRLQNRKNDSFRAIADDLAALSASALHVSHQGKTLFESGSGKFNAFASRYLPLLGLLNEKIRAGRLSPATLVRLDEKLKAPKPGFLNQFPPGSVLTVDTLKNFTLFYEDESAADHLLPLVDRKKLDKLEQGSGHFLSNREKSAVLRAGKGEVSWSFSPKALCEHAYGLKEDAALPRRNVTRDPARPDDSKFFSWDSGAFQVTRLVKNGKNDWFCFSMSGSDSKDAQVVYNQLFMAEKRLLALLGTAYPSGDGAP